MLPSLAIARKYRSTSDFHVSSPHMLIIVIVVIIPIYVMPVKQNTVFSLGICYFFREIIK